MVRAGSLMVRVCYGAQQVALSHLSHCDGSMHGIWIEIFGWIDTLFWLDVLSFGYQILPYLVELLGSRGVIDLYLGAEFIGLTPEMRGNWASHCWLPAPDSWDTHQQQRHATTLSHPPRRPCIASAPTAWFREWMLLVCALQPSASREAGPTPKLWRSWHPNKACTML